ncbi:MAG TPA: hypothetical protein VL068_10675 [Microthrixaceae bacterium]|nr:hypothetical protein [Microthrixaceae bacterium]
MLLLATEKVWHFWIAVPLALTAILIVVAIVGLYVAKVSRTRYPHSHS